MIILCISAGSSFMSIEKFQRIIPIDIIVSEFSGFCVEVLSACVLVSGIHHMGYSSS